MQGSSEAHRKLADAVDALQAVEGISIVENDVSEVPRGDEDPMQFVQRVLQGKDAGSIETREVLHFVCTLDSEDIEGDTGTQPIDEMLDNDLPEDPGSQI